MKELLARAEAYERLKMSHMSTSDRVKASREGKQIVLGINEFYKKTKDGALMEWMKRVTVKKKKIEKRLNYVPEV